MCPCRRLVEKLRPFPGMRHLDVAGGTGDVAFRVLEAMRRAEFGQQRPGAQPQQPVSSLGAELAAVVMGLGPGSRKPLVEWA